MKDLSKPGHRLATFICSLGASLLFAGPPGYASDYVSSSTYATGDYRMVFSEYATKVVGESRVLVHPLNDVDAKIKTMYDQLFKTGNTGSQRIVFDATGTGNAGLKFVKDIGSNDIRSEGMSYGMMIAVMMDDQATFDALWGFARKFMYNDDDGGRWYAWSLADTAPNYPMNRDGTKYGQNPAPDGEEYFAMALFFADHRWGSTGNSTDLKNYKAWANDTLSILGNTGDPGLWDATNNMVKFSPYETFTDPSYHLPAFYQLWGLWASSNNANWSAAADKSRTFLKNAADGATRSNTGLFSEYASYAGVPQTTTYNPLSQHSAFDAYRVINNIAMDHYWWSKSADMNGLVKGIMGFYNSDTELATAVNGFRYTGVYGLGQGSTLYITNANWSARATAPVPGLAAMNAVGAVANDESYVPKFVQYLWDQATPSGNGRYYDGLLHLFGYLHLAGYYRIYNELEGNSADLSMSTGRQDANNNPVIYWGAPNYFTVAGCPQGQTATGTFTWTMSFLADKVLPAGPDFPPITGNMTALSNGRYFGEIPAVAPAHDEYKLTILRRCSGGDLSEDTSGWVDPSGYVRTTQGYALPGSTVTLFRTDTNDSASTLRQVPNGSTIMAPYNRKNPDLTDFAGHFGWDVEYGRWYQVRASHPGCVSPTNPLQTTVSTPLIFVPPAVTDLDIRLACPTDRLKVDMTVTSDWGTGYCADVKVTNNNSIPVNWKVNFNVDGSINSSGGANLAQAGRVVTATGLSGNTILPAFTSTSGISFCATRDRKPATYTIIVRARGTSGAENINLTVGGAVLGNWNLTTSFKDYYVTTQAAGGINVVYTNDNGVAYRDVVVDFVDVNNVRYQTEDMTQNTSVFGNGRCGGGSRSEWMHCSGWVGFPAYK